MQKPSARTKTYTRYLKSPQWQAKRVQVLFRDGRRCRCCGSSMRLEVHHLSYARFGQEPLHDLLTLCHRCHAAVHAKYPQMPKEAAYG